MYRNVFGSARYTCDKCKKRLESDQIAARYGERFPGDKILQFHYCAKDAELAKRAWLIKEEKSV